MAWRLELMTEITRVQLEAVRALAEHVQGRMLPYLSSRPDLLPRQYAACALARCNRLLFSMFDMRQNGYTDVMGIATRSYLECWLIGIYLAMAPEEALDRLNEAHVHQLKRMDESWGDLSDVIERMQVGDKTSSLVWKDVAARVDQLYSVSWPGVDVATRLYEVLYRAESMMSVHGVSALYRVTCEASRRGH
jgi:hypothetical protein